MLEDVKTTLKWLSASAVTMAVFVGGSAVAGLWFWLGVTSIVFVAFLYGTARTERLERERKAAKKAKKKLRKTAASA